MSVLTQVLLLVPETLISRNVKHARKQLLDIIAFVRCQSCQLLYHIKCSGLTLKDYNRYESGLNGSWICVVCLFATLPRDPSFVLPTGGGSRVDSDTDATDSTCHNYKTSPQVSDPLLSEFSTRYFKNLKLEHLNINSLGGSKWTEIYYSMPIYWIFL